MKLIEQEHSLLNKGRTSCYVIIRDILNTKVAVVITDGLRLDGSSW